MGPPPCPHLASLFTKQPPEPRLIFQVDISTITKRKVLPETGRKEGKARCLDSEIPSFPSLSCPPFLPQSVHEDKVNTYFMSNSLPDLEVQVFLYLPQGPRFFHVNDPTNHEVHYS